MDHWAGMGGLSLQPGAAPERQRAELVLAGGTQTARAEARRCQEGAKLRALTPAPTPEGPSHRTGGCYQDFIPVSDNPLYCLDPLQKFLEEGVRGGLSKQTLLWPLHTHSYRGGAGETCGSWGNWGQREGG